MAHDSPLETRRPLPAHVLPQPPIPRNPPRTHRLLVPHLPTRRLTLLTPVSFPKMSRSPLTVILIATLLIASIHRTPAAPTLPASGPWEAEISTLEARFKAHPFPPDGIVFLGSSSIRLWNLKRDFPDLTLANCGFGGSAIPDSTAILEIGRAHV